MHLKVRGLDAKARQELRTFIQRRVWFVLGRFGRQIRRVTADLAEEKGADGTNVNRCRIIVSLTQSCHFCVEETGADLAAVVDRATHRVGHLVRREIDRQREAPDRSAGAAHFIEEAYGHELPHFQR